jgi:hypothetical protein
MPYLCVDVVYAIMVGLLVPDAKDSLSRIRVRCSAALRSELSAVCNVSHPLMFGMQSSNLLTLQQFPSLVCCSWPR